MVNPYGVVVSLNVRGLGNPTKWHYIKDLITVEGVKMVSLQETKVDFISTEKCYHLCGDDNIDCIYSEPVNGVGRILTAWPTKYFECVRYIINKWFVVFIRCFKEKNLLVIILKNTLRRKIFPCLN